MAQERLITQIDYARAGKITPQMETLIWVFLAT